VHRIDCPAAPAATADGACIARIEFDITERNPGSNFEESGDLRVDCYGKAG